MKNVPFKMNLLQISSEYGKICWQNMWLIAVSFIRPKICISKKKFREKKTISKQTKIFTVQLLQRFCILAAKNYERVMKKLAKFSLNSLVDFIISPKNFYNIKWGIKNFCFIRFCCSFFQKTLRHFFFLLLFQRY